MTERPKIYTVLPDEIRAAFPHGQFVMDQPGGIINFSCELEDDEPHVPDVEPMVRRLEEFRASTDDFLEFESPHLPGRYFLTRAGLEHVILVQPAWSAKVKPRQPENGRVQIMDHDTGLPVLRKKLN